MNLYRRLRLRLAYLLFGTELKNLCTEYYEIGYQSGRDMMATWLRESLDRAAQQMIDSDADGLWPAQKGDGGSPPAGGDCVKHV